MLLAAMWFRSYRHGDRMHGRLWGRESFLISSKQGAVTFLQFRSHGHEQWWQWEFRSYGTSDEMSFPVGDIDQYQGALGFGILQKPFYYVMRPVIDTPQGQVTLMGAASTSLRGSGLIVPYWFLMLVFGVLAAILAVKRSVRFRLSSLLLVVTGTGIVVGIARVLAQR
jgi:hypothetical protein